MMRLVLLLVGVATLLLLQMAFADEPADTAEPADPAPKLDTIMQKGSYLIGHNIGRQLRGDVIAADLVALVAGIKDGMAGRETKIERKEISGVMEAFQKEVQQAQDEQKKSQGGRNTKEGKAFLTENAKKKTVKTTASGLQYEVIQDGDGETPKSTDTVRTHYKGTLIDGTVFDSSYDRGEPAEFPVTGVIKGWVEALQLMKVGSKWKLYVPSELAYGERGAGDKIGPGAVLIFEIELLGIVP
jgi:FKBP-type peptidyl-prolyl cis-trans isomerase